MPYVITTKDHSRAVATYEEAIDAAAADWDRLCNGTAAWSLRYTGSSPVLDMMAEIIGEEGGVAYGLRDGTKIKVRSTTYGALADLAGFDELAPNAVGTQFQAFQKRIIDAYNSRYETA